MDEIIEVLSDVTSDCCADDDVDWLTDCNPLKEEVTCSVGDAECSSLECMLSGVLGNSVTSSAAVATAVVDVVVVGTATSSLL